MVYKFFDKKTSGSGIKNENIPNKESAKELQKQIIRKFNKGFRFLLCAIDIYSKYAWVIPLKDKKRVTITNAFKTILDESNRTPNKVWVNKGSEFCTRSMK